MFRIMPGVQREEPVQRTFENVKSALDTALLVRSWDTPVINEIALLELAHVVRIPYFLSTETTSMWERGSLDVEFSCVAQGQTFTGHVMGAVEGAAPVDLFSLVCVVPAGAKVYHAFTGSLTSIDWRSYDAIVIALEVGTQPAIEDRYVVTTQLAFHPFDPYARP